MDHRIGFAALAAFVLMAVGGLAVYDATVGHKLVRRAAPADPAPNWVWSDQWDAADGRSTLPPPADVAPLTAADYADALSKAGAAGKPVLVFFTADWCTWCQKMKANVLPAASVRAALSHYVLVYVDADASRGLATQFGVESLPAFVVTNAAEAKLKADAGYKDVAAFAAWLSDPSLYDQPRHKADEAKPPKTDPPAPPRRRFSPS